MPSLAVLGATGNLGRHIVSQALAKGWNVSVAVRSRARLAPEVAASVRVTYWPHRLNYERLRRSGLDWRLLCPGPMVDEPAIGLQRLRISIDALTTPLPSIAQSLPAPLLLPLFALKIPEMTIPYADAAAVILADVEANGRTSRRRIGVALPVGMKGRKKDLPEKPRQAT